MLVELGLVEQRDEGRFLTLSRGRGVRGHCPAPATDFLVTASWTTRFANEHDPQHLASAVLVAKANVSAFEILWLLKFIILNRLVAQIADTEPGAEVRSAAQGRGRPGDAGQVGAEGAYGPRPCTGKNR